jgi:hypothetical protein
MEQQQQQPQPSVISGGNVRGSKQSNNNHRNSDDGTNETTPLLPQSATSVPATTCFSPPLSFPTVAVEASRTLILASSVCSFLSTILYVAGSFVAVYGGKEGLNSSPSKLDYPFVAVAWVSLS